MGWQRRGSLCCDCAASPLGTGDIMGMHGTRSDPSYHRTWKSKITWMQCVRVYQAGT